MVVSLLPEKGNLLLKVFQINQKKIYIAYVKFLVLNYALLKMKYHGYIELTLKTTVFRIYGIEQCQSGLIHNIRFLLHRQRLYIQILAARSKLNGLTLMSLLQLSR